MDNQIIEKLNVIIQKLDAQRKDIFYTRTEAMKHYGLSRREVDKIYNIILKEKVTDIGKHQKLAKVHIDKMFMDGVKLKYV